MNLQVLGKNDASFTPIYILLKSTCCQCQLLRQHLSSYKAVGGEENRIKTYKTIGNRGRKGEEAVKEVFYNLEKDKRLGVEQPAASYHCKVFSARGHKWSHCLQSDKHQKPSMIFHLWVWLFPWKALKSQDWGNISWAISALTPSSSSGTDVWHWFGCSAFIPFVCQGVV